MKTILVTGGAGFIGSHLVNYYSEFTKVVVLDDLSMGKVSNIKESVNVEFINGDVSNKEILESIFNNYTFDYIFHLGAVASVAATVENPWSTHLINQDATLLLLEQSMKQKKQLKRFIFSSSAAVYGNSSNYIQVEDGPIDPLSPYAIDKYASEKYTLLYYQLYGIKTTAVRFFNVYGENQNPSSSYSGVLSIIMDGLIKMTQGEDFKFTKYGMGTQTRDFVYIKDAIQALVLLASEESATGEVYNIGSGEAVTLNEVIEACEIISNLTMSIEQTESRQGEVLNSLAGISKIKKIGYQPEYSLCKGIASYWINTIGD